jgi:K(+)-stimulated pyrophosphate-energized sodium pump
VLASRLLLYFLFGRAPRHRGPVTSWWGLGSRSWRASSPATSSVFHRVLHQLRHKPTKRIAQQALTGPATVIIAGIAEGMKSTWASLLTGRRRHPAAFTLRRRRQMSFLMGLYGVGIAAVGMLSTLGITLATDAYGPIADNAGGNAEMTGQPPQVRERTDARLPGQHDRRDGQGLRHRLGGADRLALFAAYIEDRSARSTRP